jgi:hypothetical protein
MKLLSAAADAMPCKCTTHGWRRDHDEAWCMLACDKHQNDMRLLPVHQLVGVRNQKCPYFGLDQANNHRHALKQGSSRHFYRRTLRPLTSPRQSLVQAGATVIKVRSG